MLVDDQFLNLGRPLTTRTHGWLLTYTLYDHISQSEEPEVGGIWSEIDRKPLSNLLIHG